MRARGAQPAYALLCSARLRLPVCNSRSLRAQVCTRAVYLSQCVRTRECVCVKPRHTDTAAIRHISLALARATRSIHTRLAKTRSTASSRLRLRPNARARGPLDSRPRRPQRFHRNSIWNQAHSVRGRRRPPPELWMRQLAATRSELKYSAGALNLGRRVVPLVWVRALVRAISACEIQQQQQRQQNNKTK